MKIEELRIRNFGKLNDKQVTFSEGMNLIYGENESGKSTLHTFMKGMIFGMERGKGRAASTDIFTKYEPWENPNYYSGILRFESGGKTFCIDRNFDKSTKRTSFLCEDDGEELSIEDGDLQVILGGLKQGTYEDTVSVGQLMIKPGQSLAGELKEFATNYYATGNSNIKLEETFRILYQGKKQVEKEAKDERKALQKSRDRLEQEASYVGRDVHALMQEEESVKSELCLRKEQEQQVLDEEDNPEGSIRWRIHPIEIVLFVMMVVAAFVVIAKPWNYIVAIVLSLICGIYVWNRLKISKKQIKTVPEIMLEEIGMQEGNVPLHKLEWERAKIAEELKEKQTLYHNLQEQLEELDEVTDTCKEQEKKRLAIQLAIDTLQALSMEMHVKLEVELNKRASEILEFITDGQYTRLLVEDDLSMSLLSGYKKISVEQVSRGTIEQTYFALRMAASELLHEEEYPAILDDTFVFYDEKRLKRTMKWLCNNRKQVLVFTCQKREAQVLNELGINWKNVTLMNGS